MSYEIQHAREVWEEMKNQEIGMHEKPIILSGEIVRGILSGSTTRIQLGEHTHKEGDRLWVQEEWQDYCPIWNGYWCGHGDAEGIAKEHKPVYRCDPHELRKRFMGKSFDHELQKEVERWSEPLKWEKPETMPRWASRITIEVVRVEQSGIAFKQVSIKPK